MTIQRTDATMKTLRAAPGDIQRAAAGGAAGVSGAATAAWSVYARHPLKICGAVLAVFGGATAMR